MHSLINNLGVPIFFCANPPFNETLEKTLKAARRAESGGYFTMKLLERKSDSWEAFVHELWDLQWTNFFNELTDELNDKIYDLSVGNLDMAHRIYREAQRLVIGSGDERITTATLEIASMLACGLSSKTEEIKLIKSDQFLPRRAKTSTSNIVKNNTEKFKTHSAGDITKPQHPEFANQLREIVGSVDILSRIKNADLFQQAGISNNPIDFLRLHDMMLDDPLVKLSTY